MELSHFVPIQNVQLLLIFVVDLFADVESFTNTDLESIVMPLKAEVLADLLHQSNYDARESAFLVEGFHQWVSYWL